MKRSRRRVARPSLVAPTLALGAACAATFAYGVHKAMAPGRWQHVFATREGEVGKKTSTGLVIREDSLFVALPHTMALHKHVEIRYGTRVVVVPVLDVGPWNIDDAYWEHDRRPASERGIGKYRRPSNIAGIDLSNPVFAQLGLPDNAYVEWRFVHQGYFALPWL